MSLNDAERLGRMLGPGITEVTCDQCFDYLDAYVDHEVSRADVDSAFPGMRAHFAGCPTCAEEHDALLELVRADSSA
jgi:hypothetical protein